MIIDPNGIASRSARGEERRDRGREGSADARYAAERQLTSLLVFRAGSRSLKAVPLSLSRALKRSPSSKIEYLERPPWCSIAAA
jgi:two-component system chemotaxis sensor kinase CheA